MKSPNWSEEELQLLREKYPIFGKSKELQSIFPNRNLSAICLKASRLGLKVINNIRKGRSNEEYVSLLENTNFIALEPYRGSTVPIKHMCCICDHEWTTRPQHVLKVGAKCPMCDIASRKVSIDTVDSVLKNANIERLSEYTGSLSTIKVRHTICGHSWNTKYSYIQQGSGCPICNKGFGYLDQHTLPVDAYFYVLEIILFNGEHFLKVGITSRSIVDRRINEISSSIGKNLVLIKPLVIARGPGADIIKLEHKILNTSTIIKHYSNIQFCGNTELKSIDCFNQILQIVKETNNVKIISSSS